MARKYGIGGVSLIINEKGRGLASLENALTGQILMRVPAGLVISEDADDPMAMLLLATQLLQSMEEDSFWTQYRSFLPTVDEFLCGGYLPLSLLKLTGDSIILQGAEQQREEYGALVPKINRQLTNCYGLASSRAIRVSK